MKGGAAAAPRRNDDDASYGRPMTVGSPDITSGACEPRHRASTHLGARRVPAVELVVPRVVAGALQLRDNAPPTLIDRQNWILASMRDEHFRLAMRNAGDDEPR